MTQIDRDTIQRANDLNAFRNYADAYWKQLHREA